MCKLNDLIKELCPNGVEYKRLGDICLIETGKLNANAAVDGGAYPFFTTSKQVSYINSWRWDCDALLVAGNANVGDVKHYCGKFEAYQRTYVLSRFSSDINSQFLYYVMASKLKEYLSSKKNEAAMTYIVLSTLQSFPIPIPPLKIQQEIVKILDKFTQLQAELQAELELQLKRLEEVRNDVLCRSYMMRADKNSHLVRLGDIGKFERCTGLQKNDLVDNPGDGLSPCLHYGQIYTYYGQVADVSKSYCDNALAERMVKAHKGDLVVATTSENLEDVGTPVVWNGNSDWAIGGETYVYRHNQNPIFLANQFMTHNFFKYKQMRQTGTKVVRLNDKALSEYQIWLPSIDIQDKIAKFLHAYDLLVNDISNGLPAEIKLRQQQYEYYRDELLSFKLTNV